jgi:DNA replication protein DnaC
VKRVGDMMGSVGQAREETLSSAADPSSQSAPPGAAGQVVRNRKPDEPCPICLGRGFLVYDVPPGDPNFNRVVPCRCTEAKLAAEHARGVRSVSNLGALDRMTFDSFVPDAAGLPEAIRRDLRTVYELSLSFAREPEGWLVLMGGYGAGKTHLAAAIANYRVSLGHPVLFVVVPDLLDYLRATFSPNSDTGLDERMEMIREIPLLILDDLGAHNSTPWAQEKLFQILNHRYNNRLATVITTNQRLEDLDPRIASRLADLDLSQKFEIPAPDFRFGQSGTGAFDRGGRSLSSLALHADQTFESFSARAGELSDEERENLERALSLARTFAEDPAGWLVLSGTYGCGKTHLAAAIANQQTARGRATPMFIVVPDLLDHLRATFSPASASTLDRVFEQVRTAPLLVLDDLGTESATPWAREKLFQLFNHRYAGRLPTVITTSNGIESLEKAEPRLASRMKDTSRCRFFAIIVPSYRGGQAQQAAKRGRPKARS